MVSCSLVLAEFGPSSDFALNKIIDKSNAQLFSSFLSSNPVAFHFQTPSRVLIIPNCMLQLPLKRLRFNQISPFASNNKKFRNDITTERLSRQDKEMEFNQDPIDVKSDGPTETTERRQEVRESEQAGERQEVTDRETTAPLADAINQLSALLTRVKISDGAESTIPPFDGTYNATQFFQAFDRKMEDASIGEQEKLLRLPNYLVRQPLELFRKLRLADRSYFQVRQILLDLYPESSEASFAKYFAMKLTGQANLETYYREKTAMGLQLGLPQEVILETLTEGLPFNDQRLVRVVPPENLGEWFRLVQRIHGPSHTPTPRCMECTSSAVQLQVLRRETLAQRMPTSTSPDDPRKSPDSANDPKITSSDSTTTKSSQRHPSRAALSRLSTNSAAYFEHHLHTHEEQKPFKCSQCDKSFIHKGSLQAHAHVHTIEHPYVCQLCDRSFNKCGNLIRHYKTKHGKRVPNMCHQCGQNFGDRDSLMVHEMEHTEVKLRCDYCEYRTADKDSLRAHRMTHSADNQVYACPNCEYTTTDLGHLAAHAHVHNGGQPYGCPECDYTTNTSEKLAKHTLVHARFSAGGPAFSCPFCDHTSTSTEEMADHKQAHMQDGERMFACPYCDFTTNYSSTLNVHKNTHTGSRPYACPYCDYKSTQSSHLATHKRTHTGERPYACNECDYKTVNSSNLQSHIIRKHTQNFPHRCSHCNKGFVTPGELQRHQLNFHP
ncbi:hypothetical protein LAZ67_2000501 [Cordylochernes scorpioides]|uniref:C2H2-type domain-containing protein n=1 Tax=Cordylochernes scorpioides TaxID=51811 RepID=A0ABY6K0K1_9ARAC|nr:hypothetical protein LAZ67_2000501 [Cordylochernes scorpioides]